MPTGNRDIVIPSTGFVVYKNLEPTGDGSGVSLRD